MARHPPAMFLLEMQSLPSRSTGGLPTWLGLGLGLELGFGLGLGLGLGLAPPPHTHLQNMGGGEDHHELVLEILLCLRAVGGQRGQRAAEGDERRLVDELTVDLG